MNKKIEFWKKKKQNKRNGLNFKLKAQKSWKVHFIRKIRWPIGEREITAVSGRVGIYEKGVNKSECTLRDMDSGIISVQKLGLRKAANGVHGI